MSQPYFFLVPLTELFLELHRTVLERQLILVVLLCLLGLCFFFFFFLKKDSPNFVKNPGAEAEPLPASCSTR